MGSFSLWWCRNDICIKVVLAAIGPYFAEEFPTPDSDPFIIPSIVEPIW